MGKTVSPPTAELAALERLKKIPDVSHFSPLVLLGSFSCLQVMITYMRAWMGSTFGQIRPLVSMVTDRVMMGKTVSPLFSRLSFIHSFPYLQVKMTSMRARMSSIFGLIGPPAVELAALERLKKIPIYLYWGKLVLPLFLSYS